MIWSANQSGQRMYSPSPTVKVSPVPMYMRGLGPMLTYPGLGQDDGTDSGLILSPDGSTGTDPSTGDVYNLDTGELILPGGISETGGAIVPEGSIYGPFQPSGATALPAGAQGPVQSPSGGAVPAGTAPGPANPNTTATIIAATAAGVKAATQPTLGPGAAPRVSVPLPGSTASSFLNQQSIAGIPNALLIVGLLGLVAVAGKR